MRRLRWTLAAVLAALLTTFTILAASRLYADNQRNWLIIAAVLSALGLAVVLVARPIMAVAQAFTEAVVSELKARR